ncbi:iron-containing alcohol dehydrogenase [Shinella sp. CPCC 101442]|uniref:iron-containing alcohol dehydrogenase family protein n=1 Tax=Shinella sp. CPCC 101442 TaxID=2932265 RepID=UPI002152A52E|nr:iron-containing alcohol dehydrogenase [Shinella sp. CPCC 101442]MCR6502339.1 iron-containing alcohol dehydrogenase [Shinella sp. CPCC 101442]
MSTQTNYQITLPTRVHFGPGSIAALPQEAAKLGRRLFLLIDPFLKGTPLEGRIVGELAAAGMKTRLWHDIVPNPRAATCDAAAAEARLWQADAIIAIGGGSTIDAAKAVSLATTNGGPVWDFTSRTNAEIGQLEKRGLPLIAVPTNAGTGAEITPFAVLSNPELKLKATIIHPYCYPDVALIDPGLHLSKPPRLTASTGIDTFLHAFEGYIGTRPNAWTDLFSIRAMELVATYLPIACADPSNIEARTRMAEACYMAGVTLGNVGVGIPHALGQALGALKDTPHGESCAAFLVSTVRWTLPEANAPLARVATIFRPDLVNLAETERANTLPEVLQAFFASIGLSGRLGALGLPRSDTETLVAIAMTNYGQDVACSLRPAGRDDLRSIVLASF